MLVFGNSVVKPQDRGTWRISHPLPHRNMEHSPDNSVSLRNLVEQPHQNLLGILSMLLSGEVPEW